MFSLSDGEEIMTLAFFVLIQNQSVTDRQTDRQTDGQTDIPPLAIKNAANVTMLNNINNDSLKLPEGHFVARQIHTHHEGELVP